MCDCAKWWLKLWLDSFKLFYLYFLQPSFRLHISLVSLVSNSPLQSLVTGLKMNFSSCKPNITGNDGEVCQHLLSFESTWIGKVNANIWLLTSAGMKSGRFFFYTLHTAAKWLSVSYERDAWNWHLVFYFSLKVEYDKLANEKTEMQRNYVMVR